ncbi:hypothetical protein GCM10027418_21720 [Mariniluteicoccus endophyticus]
METNSYDPVSALADVDGSNAAIAERLVTPWWYHPVLGLALGALCLVSGRVVESPLLAVMAGAGVALVSALLVGVYRRRTGLWVGPAQTGPRSRALWLAHSGLTIVVLVAAFGSGGHPTLAWLPWAAAAVALVGTIVLGRAVDAALRDEIRSGTAHATQR